MYKLFKKIIGQVISLAIFWTIFLVSIFIVYGYRYDFVENEIIQTGIIDICTTPKNATFYLDAKFYSNKACEKIYGIDIGFHELEVYKPGYYPWKKYIYTDNKNVDSYSQILLIPHSEYQKNIILDKDVDSMWASPDQSQLAIYQERLNLIKIFSYAYSRPLIIEAKYPIHDLTWLNHKNLIVDTSQGRYQINTQQKIWKPVKSLAFHPQVLNSNLIIHHNELWKKEKGIKKFITRYKHAIESAQYFYNMSNLLIVTQTEIRICDFEGENCHLIATKDSNTTIAHPPNSKEIIFIKNRQLQQFSLEEPNEESDFEISI